MTRRSLRAAAWVPAMGVALALAAAGCAHTGGSGGVTGTTDKVPAPDSITVALWHFDEGAGTKLSDALGASDATVGGTGFTWITEP